MLLPSQGFGGQAMPSAGRLEKLLRAGLKPAKHRVIRKIFLTNPLNFIIVTTNHMKIFLRRK